MKSDDQDRRDSARAVAALAIARAAADFPDFGAPELPLQKLEERDRRLCLAIYRTTVQRWLTLTYLLDQRLKKPMRKLHPDVQGILLTAAAQLIFMDRIPAHAAVDAAVGLTRAMGHPQTSGLVNAVLRRMTSMVASVHESEPWAPAMNRLPLGAGYVELTDVNLPRTDNLLHHLQIATSVPLTLLSAWQKEHGSARVRQLALHTCENPPTVVAVEEGCEFDDATSAACVAHETQGFFVWQGSSELLATFLAGHPERRVQDPAASLAVESTMHLKPMVILDYCAGRGTKTRQLANLHPQAKIIACEPDTSRLKDLRALAQQDPNVTATDLDGLSVVMEGRRADLLVLDVPCSNTGVLARRPEARYRYSASSLKSLVDLQREIITRSLQFLAAGGHVLYSTCSVDRLENQQQTKWMLEQRQRHGPWRIDHENQLLPSGTGVSYHDGSYSVLARAGV